MLTQKQRKMLFVILDVICLIFLDQKSLLPLFLNYENPCVFPDPSSSFQNRYYFISVLICLALSCTEPASLLRRRTDVLVGQRQSCNYYGRQISGQPPLKYIACDLLKQNWGLKPKYHQNKLKCFRLLEINFRVQELKLLTAFSKTHINISAACCIIQSCLVHIQLMFLNVKGQKIWPSDLNFKIFFTVL